MITQTRGALLAVSLFAMAGSAVSADIARTSGRVAMPPFFADEPGSAHPETLLVRFHNSVSPERRQALLAEAGVVETLITYRLLPGLFAVRVPAEGRDAARAALLAQPDVMYAELDYIRSVNVQNTPYGIPLVKAPETWLARGSQGAGGRVAVLDTGVDTQHPDLPPTFAAASFINGETFEDGHAHGTHCSGTVLALDNDQGVVGVAPTASLLIGKVLANSGSGPTSSVMAGADWAVFNGANVISMSLGGGSPSQAEEDLYAEAMRRNVLVVAAAGNSSSIEPSYPGAYPPVMCVSALDSNKQLAGFSNFGPHVDIAGPGVGVESTVPLFDNRGNWLSADRTIRRLTGSGTGSVQGQIIFCGFGGTEADIPDTVAGNIAHIRRGSGDGSSITFRTKTLNALAKGAIGVIISNNNGGVFSGTLNGGVSIPVVAVSQADGDLLQANSGTNGTVIAGARVASGYAFFSGTSMATPHVAGVAGLMVGTFGQQRLTSALLREALEASAEDLGAEGDDDAFGYGLVNAEAAAAYLATRVVPCLADYNRDGTVNQEDLGGYITAFLNEAGEPGEPGFGYGEPCPQNPDPFSFGYAADFNRDCALDQEDLGGYVTEFLSNCE